MRGRKDSLVHPQVQGFPAWAHPGQIGKHRYPFHRYQDRRSTSMCGALTERLTYPIHSSEIDKAHLRPVRSNWSRSIAVYGCHMGEESSSMLALILRCQLGY